MVSSCRICAQACVQGARRAARAAIRAAALATHMSSIVRTGGCAVGGVSVASPLRARNEPSPAGRRPRPSAAPTATTPCPAPRNTGAGRKPGAHGLRSSLRETGGTGQQRHALLGVPPTTWRRLDAHLGGVHEAEGEANARDHDAQRHEPVRHQPPAPAVQRQQRRVDGAAVAGLKPRLQGAPAAEHVALLTGLKPRHARPVACPHCAPSR